MNKILVTEISEIDFRKLNLTVSKQEKIENRDGAVAYKMVQHYLNDILNKEIAATMANGYESDLRDLKMPVTIAIHTDVGYYLDKFMNQFTGAQTYQLGWGIKHLYSTRDYYECHDDYWRVSKKETRVIYRVYLSDAYAKDFFLKHFSVNVKTINDRQHIETSYSWNTDAHVYEPTHSTLITKCKGHTAYEQTDLIEASTEEIDAVLTQIKTKYDIL